MLIYHLFADDGIESEPLSGYGRVVRVGWDVRKNGFSEAVLGDVGDIPLQPGADLAVLHPPCYRWTQRRDEDAPNLIPLARRVGRELADEYVIENQATAPLEEPSDGALVTLTGDMFGLPVEYERSFECSFRVEQPPRTGRRPRHRVENTRPKAYWKSIKGVTGDYRSQQLITSGTPAAYVHHIMRHLCDGYGYEVPDEQTTLSTLST